MSNLFNIDVHCCRIVTVDVSSWKVVSEIERPKTVYISFSPKGSYLNSWEHFTGPYKINECNNDISDFVSRALFCISVSPEHPSGTPNLNIWKTEDGSLIHSFIQKKQMSWCVFLRS